MNKPTIKTIYTDFDHFIAFGMGSGLINPAPGTWGTISGLLLMLALDALLPFWALILLLLLLTILGTKCAHESSKKLGVHDFGGIVIDEWAGIWLTLICFPLTLANIIVGFILFRIFDILKPWPIKWLDSKVSGGIGIMIDDIVAGFAAAICLWFLQGVIV